MKTLERCLITFLAISVFTCLYWVLENKYQGYCGKSEQTIEQGYMILDSPRLKTSVEYEYNVVWSVYDDIDKVTPELIEKRQQQADSVMKQLKRIRKYKIYE